MHLREQELHRILRRRLLGQLLERRSQTRQLQSALLNQGGGDMCLGVGRLGFHCRVDCRLHRLVDVMRLEVRFNASLVLDRFGVSWLGCVAQGLRLPRSHHDQGRRYTTWGVVWK